MGRHAQPEVKQSLLEACTDFALAEGLPDRIEPLARASGTSPRMLLYYFGTRDELLRAILRRARDRQLHAFREFLHPSPDEPYTATLMRAWQSMSGPAGQPYIRMFGQLSATTEQHLWPHFRRLATTDWLPPLEAGLRSLGRPDAATLTLAVIRGLLLDLDATGDAARADDAFADYLELLAMHTARPD
jgi:AcrR family transcriptional regulator